VLEATTDSHRWTRQTVIYTGSQVAPPFDAMSTPDLTELEPSLAARRVERLLQAANEHATGVPVAELSELLPRGAPSELDSVAEWLSRMAPVTNVVGGVAYLGSPPAPPGAEEDRRERGRRFLRQAHDLLTHVLAPGQSLIQCAAVTGSVAYGEPQAGDDCDLLVVTRRGGLWPFLAFTYLKLRIDPSAYPPSGPPMWCFNYILDEAAAREEFARPRGFLFAREALAARVVTGDRYYRGLLGRTRWLDDEAPRLYDRWRQEGFPAPEPERPAPALVRAVNVLLFPVLAAYLQAVGLIRNHRLRDQGRSGETFRTVTRLRRMAYETEKFGRLTELFAPATVVAPEA
jgi:hypothetical protein